MTVGFRYGQRNDLSLVCKFMDKSTGKIDGEFVIFKN